MDMLKIVGIILIVAGVLGLVYGGFTYTSDTHDADLGPIEFTVTEQERVNVPIWAGVGSIAIGGALLLFGRRKS